MERLDLAIWREEAARPRQAARDRDGRGGL